MGTDRSLLLPDADRERHQIIFGQTGSGKTAYMVGIVMQDIVNNYHSVVVVDPLGASLVSTVIEFLGLLNMKLTMMAQTGIPAYDARIRKYRDDLLGRIVILDFSDMAKSNLFFNPLEKVQGLTADECAGQLLRTFENASGADLDTQLLRQLNLKSAFALVAEAGGTLLDVPYFYGLDHVGFNRHIEYLSNKAEAEGRSLGLQYVREYSARFIAGVPDGKERRDREQSCWTAMNLFLGDERVRRFVSAPHGNLDFEDIVNGSPGKILLVNIPQGTDLNTLKILGQMVVDRVRLTCERRTPLQRRNKVSLLLDEAHLLFSEMISETYAVARNTGQNYIIAGQDFSQYKRADEDGHLFNNVMANSATMVFFRLSERDSSEIAFTVFRPCGDKVRRQYVEISNSRGTTEALSKSDSQSENHGRSESHGKNNTTATAEAVSAGFGVNEGVTESHADAVTEGYSKGKNRMRSSSHTHGMSVSKMKSEAQTSGIGSAHAVSHADGKNSSTGNSAGTSNNSGTSAAAFNSFNSGSNSSHRLGLDTAMGAAASSSGHGHGSNGGISESHGTNDGTFSSEGQSTMDGYSDVDSSVQSTGKGTSSGQTVSSSVTFGEAESESEIDSHGRTKTDGVAHSQSRNTTVGFGRSRSVAEGKSETITEAKSEGTSTTIGESHTKSESSAETEKIEWYNVNDQARVMSYELMDLPKREAYVLTREDGKVTRIRTNDISYEYNNVFGGVDYTADFLKRVRPKETPKIPTDTVFDRIETERQQKVRRKEPEEF